MAVCLTPQSEEIKNFLPMFSTSISGATIIIMILSQIFCSIIASDSKLGLAFIVANYVMCNVNLILTYRVGGETILEICWYVFLLFTIIVLMCVFVIVNNKNVKANIDQTVRLFEFQ